MRTWHVHTATYLDSGNAPVRKLFSVMTKDRKELLNMLSEYLENEDIVASLNKTNESIIKRLEREKEEL